ncbi:hypothetical protein PC9H_010109 [Pleurotus ostreatus]|uniref:Carboxylic ester hydrolase n=1 Tax=Pleurotus ostreatus TaxID=5322 RepID=A0A8H7DR95_PLEOS|nr:uncharacterized protein PC9H_010109 [Pleurotus ostreatus]KAF7424798.1 hypothetical protein PC9H_010109 [Pleurotus ostreatus]KAJ8692187.1 hypothetical protein PTI98_009522 [Pleurotus ostreatus]
MLKGSTLLLATLCFQLAVAQRKSSVVDLGYAKYQGTIDDVANVTSYLGIRYAAAPTQDLRWRAPQPPSTFPGVQSARTPPPQCPQALPNTTVPDTFPLSGSSMGTEDCLFLNVFIPRDRPRNKKLPVIAWIHGGGYSLGNASSYDGTKLIRESNDAVIVVSIQYRLGIFGFLSSTKIRENGALNAGLLDQEFALQWIQSNIDRFGGDPGQVTIWGVSAGAGSVLQHIVARNGATNPPLFRAAMTSSTFLPSQYHFDDPIPETIYSSVVSNAGCATAGDTLACLRGANTTTLQAANVAACRSGFFGTFPLVPVVDGEFIKERPTEVLQKGHVNGHALLSVSNVNEGDIFVDQTTASTVETLQFSHDLFPRLTLAQRSKVARLYAGVGTPIEQANRIMGEAIFICPTYVLLEAFPGSFKGEYAVPPALHGDDLPHYFPSFSPRPFDDPDFSTSFTQSFLDFVLNLDPNVKVNGRNLTPHWNRYSPFDSEMIFNRTEEGQLNIHSGSTDVELLERCAFWQGVSELTAQ